MRSHQKIVRVIGWLAAVCLLIALAAGTVFAGEVLEFDIHTERMLNYLADPDAANVFEYAKGAKDYSKPEKLVCDFSQDEGIGESETYVFQKSADAAFTDPLTVTGLEKKEYELVNLLLGEHFFYIIYYFINSF